MVGHYLLTFTEAQEDRVLTSHMTPGNTQGGKCLVHLAYLTAPDPRAYHLRTNWMWRTCREAVPNRYDHLCGRFGAPRVNAAIRNRILSNRAWRTLSGSAVVQQEATP